MKRILSILACIMVVGGFCMIDSQSTYAKTEQTGSIDWSQVEEPELKTTEIYQDSSAVEEALSRVGAVDSSDFANVKATADIPGTPDAMLKCSIMIKDALLNGEEWISISDLGVNDSDVQFDYLNYYSPYLDGRNIEVGLCTDNGVYSEIRITNNLSSKETEEWVKLIDKKLDELSALISGDELSTADKALILNDYMAANYHYDTTYSYYHPSDLLTKNTGVCQSYAGLFQYVMNLNGIECYSAVSSAMNHVWNIIGFGGKYYHVDVTWDDPINDCFGQAGHRYLLVSDETMKDAEHKHHDWRLAEYACDDSSYESAYFTDANSPVVFEGTSRYYIGSEGLTKYDVQTGTSSVLDSEASWCSGLFEYNGFLYYNSFGSIKRYNLSRGSVKVYESIDTSNDDVIFGCLREGNEILYDVGTRIVDYKDKSIMRQDLPPECTDGHSWEEDYTVDRPASWSQDGVKSIQCYNCGAAKEEVAIPKAETIELPSEEYTYSEEYIEPEVSVKDSEGNLINKDYYEVAYENNVDAGTAKVIVTLDSEHYTGSCTRTFEILPIDISGKSFFLSNSRYTYNGSYKKPDINYAYFDTMFYEDDYDVAYENNRYVGKAKAIISGKGNYTGTVTKYFTINPKGTSLKSVSASKKAFTAKWAKQSTQTTGYQIRYSLKSSMSSAKTVTIAKNQTTSKKVAKLKAKKRYYVQIRTYKTVGGTMYYSGWSSKKSVRTK